MTQVATRIRRNHGDHYQGLYSEKWNGNTKMYKQDILPVKKYGREWEPAPASHEILQSMPVSLVKGANK